MQTGDVRPEAENPAVYDGTGACFFQEPAHFLSFFLPTGKKMRFFAG
jgi:hypothetical protein